MRPRIAKLGFLALLNSLIAFSAAADAAASFGGQFPVRRVVVEWNRIYLEVDQVNNPEHCGVATMIALPIDTTVRDLFYSMALTAVGSGKRVSVWTDGCAPSPWGTVPNAYHLSLLS